MQMHLARTSERRQPLDHRHQLHPVVGGVRLAAEKLLGVITEGHQHAPAARPGVAVLADLKQRVRQARYQAQRRVNAELIALYWQIGRVLVDRTDRAQWGDKVITRLSEDLRAEFPGSTGFSPRNLLYMRSFARAWPDLGANAQQPAARLQWGHLMVLVDKLGERDLLDWYAAQAVTHGWSRAVLEHHIKTLAHTRFGTAPTNFDRILSPDASDLAQQLTKDPYIFDFLTIEPGYAERQLEQSLVDKIQHTLSELGAGFSFVGRRDSTATAKTGTPATVPPPRPPARATSAPDSTTTGSAISAVRSASGM